MDRSRSHKYLFRTDFLKCVYKWSKLIIILKAPEYFKLLNKSGVCRTSEDIYK